MIKDESIDIKVRYEVACDTCLKDHIPELWGKIPENDKILFCREDPMHCKERKLVLFWTFIIKEEMGELEKLIASFSSISQNIYGFEVAARFGNTAATKFFFI